MVILPSSLSRKVLLWLADYAPTPIIRLAAGSSIEKTVEWYNRIMLNDLSRWSESVISLQHETDKLICMTVVEEGKRVAFIYQPDGEQPQVLSLEHVLDPLTQLTTHYRRDEVVEKAKSIDLPKVFVELLRQGNDTDNQLQITVSAKAPEYARIEQIVDAALLHDLLKSEKKLIKLGIPLHRMVTPYLQNKGYKGLYFQFTNKLCLQIYSDGYGWSGDFTLLVYAPEWGAEERMKKDIAKLQLAEPPVLIKTNRHGQIQLF